MDTRPGAPHVFGGHRTAPNSQNDERKPLGKVNLGDTRDCDVTEMPLFTHPGHAHICMWAKVQPKLSLLAEIQDPRLRHEESMRVTMTQMAPWLTVPNCDLALWNGWNPKYLTPLLRTSYIAKEWSNLNFGTFALLVAGLQLTARWPLDVQMSSTLGFPKFWVHWGEISDLNRKVVLLTCPLRQV